MKYDFVLKEGFIIILILYKINIKNFDLLRNNFKFIKNFFFVIKFICICMKVNLEESVLK